jgi:hypothetical protein
MTPKEKAQELVERFREYSHTEFISYRGGYQLDTQIQNAKQCALIAVAFAKENPLNTNGYNKYLDEVKSEIEAL